MNFPPLPEPLPPVDLNLADRKDLLLLYGVGPVLVDRLIAGRPYAKIDDLVRIKGFNTGLVERLRPMLMLSNPLQPSDNSVSEPPEAEAQAPSAASEVIAPVTEPLEAENPPAPAVEPTPQAQTGPETSFLKNWRRVLPEIKWPSSLNRPVDLRLLLISNLVTLMMACLVIFGFLSIVNGGLHYAGAGDAAALSQQAKDLTGRTDKLRTDLEGLRTRLDTLDSLSGRISTVEKQSQSVRTDMDQALKDVALMQTQVKDIDDQVSLLQNRSDVFDHFLAGLKDLVNNSTKP